MPCCALKASSADRSTRLFLSARLTMAAARAAASLLACILVIAAGSVHAENVVTITGEASFKEAVSSSDFVVMEFYGEWLCHR